MMHSTPVCTLVLLAFCAACVSVPQGQYGQYVAGREKHLKIGTGKPLTIYRVKYWQFASGEPPAVQLEYEAIDPLDDTAALKRTARRLWPAFAPYVESLHLSDAIVTATVLHRFGTTGAWFVRTRHFGLLEHEDSSGAWRFIGDSSLLPPADYADGPQILEPDGRPMAFSRTPPTVP